MRAKVRQNRSAADVYDFKHGAALLPCLPDLFCLALLALALSQIGCLSWQQLGCITMRTLSSLLLHAVLFLSAAGARCPYIFVWFLQWRKKRMRRLKRKRRRQRSK